MCNGNTRQKLFDRVEKFIGRYKMLIHSKLLEEKMKTGKVVEL